MFPFPPPPLFPIWPFILCQNGHSPIPQNKFEEIPQANERMALLPFPALLFLCSLLSSFLLIASGHQPSSPNRAKRFAGFGGPLSTVGGNLGCVVSKEKLFINGRFTRDLGEDEQEEMKQYKRALERFREEVKAFIEQQQKQFQLAESEVKLALLQQKKQPEPPKRPSFCNEKSATQYVFDGCTVQGNNVFIGDSFVRKLTPEEQLELAQFEEQFGAYQEAVTAGFKKQMEQFFGRQFGPIFGNGNSTDLAVREGNVRGEETKVPELQLPKEPKAPEFCTLIV